MQSTILVETRIGRLAVTIDGPSDRPTALLWPSLFTSGASSWGPQLEGLKALGWRTLLVDPPGTGASERAPRLFTIEQCADAAFAILDAIGTEKAAFLGVSWGGFVAMRAALAKPRRVTALVLSNSSARRMPLATRMRDRCVAQMIRIGIPGGLGRIAVPQLIGERARTTDPAFAEELTREIDRLDKLSLSRTVRSVLADRTDVTQVINRITAPTIVIAGQADEALPLDHQEQIVDLIPGATLHILPDVAHLAPREAPDAVAALLRDFLPGTASNSI